MKTALVLSIAMPLVSLLWSRNFHTDLLLSTGATVLGGLMATLFVWLWTKQTEPSTIDQVSKSHKLIIIICGTFVLVIGGMLFARFIDYPATPDPVPAHSGLDNMKIIEFHSYRLAGFIDKTYFWRMDIDEEALLKIADTFNLEQITEVQDDFFHWRPYWWPKKLPKNYLAFRSPGYEIGTRPSDAWYYYLVYDQDKQRAYIWVDQNF